MEYRGRVALVTGASSGIGRQIAFDLADRGASLALVARRAELLEETSRECETRGAPRVLRLQGDLAQPGLPEKVAARVLEEFGAAHILVNNAGVSKHVQIYDLTPEEVDHTMAVNFTAPAHLTLALLPTMLRQNLGFIVNISSVAGRMPPPRESAYAASKYALTGWSEGLALDLEGSGIHCAVVHVGPIDTEMWDKLDSEARFKGKKHPPSRVSAAVLRCIEQRRHEVTVPRRMGLAYALKALAPRLFRRGAARYDPVPEDVIARARERARTSDT